MKIFYQFFGDGCTAGYKIADSTTEKISNSPEEKQIRCQVGDMEDVPDGSYTLAVGLYHPEARLPVVAPPGFTVSASRLLLAETIQIPTR